MTCESAIGAPNQVSVTAAARNSCLVASRMVHAMKYTLQAICRQKHFD